MYCVKKMQSNLIWTFKTKHQTKDVLLVSSSRQLFYNPASVPIHPWASLKCQTAGTYMYFNLTVNYKWTFPAVMWRNKLIIIL